VFCALWLNIIKIKKVKLTHSKNLKNVIQLSDQPHQEFVVKTMNYIMKWSTFFIDKYIIILCYIYIYKYITISFLDVFICTLYSKLIVMNCVIIYL